MIPPYIPPDIPYIPHPPLHTITICKTESSCTRGRVSCVFYVREKNDEKKYEAVKEEEESFSREKKPRPPKKLIIETPLIS